MNAILHIHPIAMCDDVVPNSVTDDEARQYFTIAFAMITVGQIGNAEDNYAWTILWDNVTCAP